MFENLARRARPILTFAPLRRTRRNHGLEHATVHVLQRTMPTLRVSGFSSPIGFVLVSNADGDSLKKAAHSALERMRKGEHALAVHPNCGTNLLTTAVLCVGASMLFLGGRRISKNRLNNALSMTMLALMVGPMLGMRLQKHFTTEGDPGDLAIGHVFSETIRFPLWKTQVTVTVVKTEAG